MRQYEDSIQRLGVARIDCLVIHGLDYSATTLAGVSAHVDRLEAGGIRALMELRESGNIGAIGLGVNEECPVVRVRRLRLLCSPPCAALLQARGSDL